MGKVFVIQLGMRIIRAGLLCKARRAASTLSLVLADIRTPFEKPF